MASVMMLMFRLKLTTDVQPVPCSDCFAVTRVWIPGGVFWFPGIGNQEMSFPGFPGARE